jgi:hypothetical protein
MPLCCDDDDGGVCVDVGVATMMLVEFVTMFVLRR